MTDNKGGQKPVKKGGYQPTGDPTPKNPPQGKKSGGEAQGKKS